MLASSHVASVDTEVKRVLHSAHAGLLKDTSLIRDWWTLCYSQCLSWQLMVVWGPFCSLVFGCGGAVSKFPV